MSGFEIAGVILGAYPAIVGALQIYKATKGGKGAESLARHLKTEEIIFKDFVSHLLEGHVSQGAWRCVSWDDAGLQKSLKNRLGSDKAENLIAILDEINELLKTIKEELAPIDDGIEILRRFRNRMRCIRFNLPQSALKDQLENLTSCNTQLQRLLANRSLPSEEPSQKKSKTSRRYLWRGRTHAVDIYKALDASYRCKCEVPHHANLGLPQISDDVREGNSLITGLQYELLFSVDCVEESATPAIESCLTEEPAQLTRSWTQSTSLSGETLSGSRRYSITECDQSEKRHIPDLCHFTRSFDSKDGFPDCHAGVLKIDKKLYQLDTPTSLDSHPLSVKHLDSLLSDQNFLLSRKERIGLALTLSHTVLSLHSTPWIESCWTWHDFCIDRSIEGKLFATHKFYSCHTTSPISDDAAAAMISDFWEIVGEPTLTRLGFALIELALGKRLSELRPDHKFRSSDVDALDFLTAKNLIESGRVMQAESQTYENVVRACVLHQFISDSEVIHLDSSRTNFQENVEHSIVEPLHGIVTASWGTV